MRIACALVAMLHLVFIAGYGCNYAPAPTDTQDVEMSPVSAHVSSALVTFEVEGETVYVTSYEKERIAQSTIINLVLDAEDGTFYYSLEVRETQIADGVEYNSAALLDANGNLLVGLDYAWPYVENEPGWISITERTQYDVLRMKSEFSENTIIETYNMNGQIKSIEYPTETACLARTATKSDDGEVRISASGKDKAMAELACWEPLVDPHSTLNYNKDGEFFVRVLTNPDFVEWAENEFAEDGLGKQTFTLEKLCSWAGAVSLLKCFFGGGWMNFICIASTGISIACIIKGIAGGT